MPGRTKDSLRYRRPGKWATGAATEGESLNNLSQGNIMQVVIRSSVRCHVHASSTRILSLALADWMAIEKQADKRGAAGDG